MNVQMTSHANCVAKGKRDPLAIQPKKLLDTFARLSADVRDLMVSQKKLREAMTRAKVRAAFLGSPNG